MIPRLALFLLSLSAPMTFLGPGAWANESRDPTSRSIPTFAEQTLAGFTRQGDEIAARESSEPSLTKLLGRQFDLSQLSPHRDNCRWLVCYDDELTAKLKQLNLDYNRDIRHRAIRPPSGPQLRPAPPRKPWKGLNSLFRDAGQNREYFDYLTVAGTALSVGQMVNPIAGFAAAATVKGAQTFLFPALKKNGKQATLEPDEKVLAAVLNEFDRRLTWLGSDTHHRLSELDNKIDSLEGIVGRFLVANSDQERQDIIIEVVNHAAQQQILEAMKAQKDLQHRQDAIEGIDHLVGGLAELVGRTNPKLGKTVAKMGRFGTQVASAVALTASNIYLGVGIFVKAFVDLGRSDLSGEQYEHIIKHLDYIDTQLQYIATRVDGIHDKLDEMDRKFSRTIGAVYVSMHNRFDEVAAKIDTALKEEAIRDRQLHGAIRQLSGKIDLSRLEDQEYRNELNLNQVLQHIRAALPNIYGNVSESKVKNLDGNLSLFEFCADTLAYNPRATRGFLSVATNTGVEIVQSLGSAELVEYALTDHKLMNGAPYQELSEWNALVESILQSDNTSSVVAPDVLLQGLSADAYVQLAEFVMSEKPEHEALRKAYEIFDGFQGHRRDDFPPAGTRIRDIRKLLEGTKRLLASRPKLVKKVFELYREELAEFEQMLHDEYKKYSPFDVWGEPTQPSHKNSVNRFITDINNDNQIRNCSTRRGYHFPMDAEMKLAFSHLAKDSRHLVMDELGLKPLQVCYEVEWVDKGTDHLFRRREDGGKVGNRSWAAYEYNRYPARALKLKFQVRSGEKVAGEVSVELNTRYLSHKRAIMRNLIYPIWAEKKTSTAPRTPYSYEAKAPDAADFNQGRYAKFRGPHDGNRLIKDFFPQQTNPFIPPVFLKREKRGIIQFDRKFWHWTDATPFDWDNGPTEEQQNTFWIELQTIQEPIHEDDLLKSFYGKDTLDENLQIVRPSNGLSNAATVSIALKEALKDVPPIEVGGATALRQELKLSDEYGFLVRDIVRAYRNFFHFVVRDEIDLTTDAQTTGPSMTSMEALRALAESLKNDRVHSLSQNIKASNLSREEKERVNQIVEKYFAQYLKEEAFEDYVAIASELYSKGYKIDRSISERMRDGDGNGELKFLRVAEKLDGLQRLAEMAIKWDFSVPTDSVALNHFRAGTPGIVKSRDDVHALVQREVRTQDLSLVTSSYSFMGGDAVRLLVDRGVPLMALVGDSEELLDGRWTILNLMKISLYQAEESYDRLLEERGTIAIDHPIIDVPLRRVRKVIKYLDDHYDDNGMRKK